MDSIFELGPRACNTQLAGRLKNGEWGDIHREEHKLEEDQEQWSFNSVAPFLLGTEISSDPEKNDLLRLRSPTDRILSAGAKA